MIIQPSGLKKQAADQSSLERFKESVVLSLHHLNFACANAKNATTVQGQNWGRTLAECQAKMTPIVNEVNQLLSQVPQQPPPRAKRP